MSRVLLVLAGAAATLALSVGTAVAEEQYVCVLTDADNDKGYCVTVWYPDPS